MPLSVNAKRMYPSRGFTLIEVLVSVAVLCVLIMISAPYLHEFFVKNKIRRIADDFHQSILKAKNTSANKNICTTLCMSTTVANPSPRCASSGDYDWQVGWIVFLNHECDSSLNIPKSPEDVIEVRMSAGDDYHLVSQNTRRKIVFGAIGISSLSGSGEFDLIYSASNHRLTQKFGLNICVDALGRSRNIPAANNCSNYK